MCAGLLLAVGLAGLAGCAGETTKPAANRPDGEGYAGVGELVVRIGVQQQLPGLVETLVARKHERGSIEIRYQGLDGSGRALFERHDSDALAERPPESNLPTSAKGTVLVPVAAPAEGGEGTAPAEPNTREIAVDLRLNRQLHVQGKIIEVIEATSTGVVFHLY